MVGMEFEDDSVASLLHAAHEVLEVERALGGQLLPREMNPLPEMAAVSVATGPDTMARNTSRPAAPQAAPRPVTRPANAAPAAVQAEVPPEQRASVLAAIDEQEVKPCRKCVLCKTRTQTVFADGNPNAELIFVGEGPGADEDEQGLPFVGRAGQKLNEMIGAMGLRRDQVYICNVVKCRPPGNRTPLPEEMEACWGYLERQIRIIHPKVIVVLGNAAVKALLHNEIGITKLRGQWQELWGIPVMPTFHPAYLLRQYTPENRKRVWSDLQAVMAKLGLKK